MASSSVGGLDATTSASNVGGKTAHDPIASGGAQASAPRMPPQHVRGKLAQTWVQKGVPLYLSPAYSPFATTVQAGVQNTSKFQPDIKNIDTKDRSPSRELILRLSRVDTLVAADELRKKYPGQKIAVLNMANPGVAGGGLLYGSLAQEEALCMRTTLYQSLSRSLYPLKIPDVIYSPDMLVCKGFDGSWTGHDIPDADKFFVDVISPAAVRGPRIRIDQQRSRNVYADPVERQAMVSGLKSIIHAAVQKGATGLVLGAWGCGIFSNPVEEVASIMEEIIFGPNNQLPQTNWAALGLKEIVVAIFDQDHARGYPVWNGFANQFRKSHPLPEGMTPVETIEISRVFRWPVAAANPNDLSPSPSSGGGGGGGGGSDGGNDSNGDSDGLDSIFNYNDDESGSGSGSESESESGMSDEEQWNHDNTKTAQQTAHILFKTVNPFDSDNNTTRPRSPLSPQGFNNPLPTVAAGPVYNSSAVVASPAPVTTQAYVPCRLDRWRQELTPPESPRSPSLPDYESDED